MQLLADLLYIACGCLAFLCAEVCRFVCGMLNRPKNVLTQYRCKLSFSFMPHSAFAAVGAPRLPPLHVYYKPVTSQLQLP